MMIQGKFIGTAEKANVFCIEKKFTLDAFEKAELFATALGLYFAEINGVRVGCDYLAPGWTYYNKTLQVQTYDVTNLLKPGENVLRFTVAQGWYCGGYFCDRKRLYGDMSAVAADLAVDGKICCATDETWRSEESPIRFSHLYDGETKDLTAPLRSLTAVEVAWDKRTLKMQICEPVRDIERLRVKKIIQTPRGDTVYDFGQNLAGVAEIKTPENFDGTVTLKFAEILVDGEFYTDNLRGAAATDRFTAHGAHVFSPEFTYHGFRYLKIDGAEISAENITAIVRHTDMKRTGSIKTDNARFQRLIDNVTWGQKGNFVDIPTDCPQRDERLGWTGDINAFCRTAAYNFDVRKILKKWLGSCRDEQKETGEIANVAPDCLEDKKTSAMWCDAITFVPWKLYEMYGDESFLSENFEAMKKFISARENTMKNGLVARGNEYGDWLALDGEYLVGNGVCGRTDTYFLTNAFQVKSLEIVAKSAKILGKEEESKIYRRKAAELLKKMRGEYFTKSGRLAFDTVTAQVIALQFGIVPESARDELAKRLNDGVILRKYRISTGFIGTAYLLFALSDNGYFETARRVLLNNAYPGWLYEADMGATTIWERWDSLTPDGKPNPDGMNSYNHYAYGVFEEFVYRRIAGIEAAAPGFKKVRIAPHPAKGLPGLRAVYESVNGKIVSAYRQKNGKIVYEIEIPSGVTAEVILPGEQAVGAESGRHTFERASEELSCEPYTEESFVSEIRQNPVARKAFKEIFGDFFEVKDSVWNPRLKTIGGLAEARIAAGKIGKEKFAELFRRANERFKELSAAKIVFEKPKRN